MKNKTKKIIASLLIPAMLLSFAACSSTSDVEVTTTASESPRSESTPTETESASESETEAETSPKESESDSSQSETEVSAAETTESETKEAETFDSEKTEETEASVTMVTPAETIRTTPPAPPAVSADPPKTSSAVKPTQPTTKPPVTSVTSAAPTTSPLPAATETKEPEETSQDVFVFLDSEPASQSTSRSVTETTAVTTTEKTPEPTSATEETPSTTPSVPPAPPSIPSPPRPTPPPSTSSAPESSTPPSESSSAPDSSEPPSESSSDTSESTVPPPETSTSAPEVTTTPEITTTPEATEPQPPKDPSEGMRDMTTMELVRDMGLGINLGNTLESYGKWIDKYNPTVNGYETAWGSPTITKDIIKGYAECGFGVIRIPVAWSNMMLENYTIHPDYMARVKQIVDWTLDSGMYAVVNIHYDSGWWEKFPTEKEECMTKYTRVWEQITEAFKDYPDKLMFESLNEEGGWDSLWNRYSGSTEGKAESFGLLNEINQKFVDIVRSAGGNNPKRHLLIAGYNTDVVLTCDPLYKMPTDIENRCAVSVHYYIPSTFCILEEDADWGTARTEWGNEADVKELNDNMDLLKTTFIDKGIPVIIGEYGTTTGNKTPEMIRLFLSSVAREAYKRQLCPVLWDTHNHFYDRNQCEFIDEELLRQIMAAKN